MVRFIIIVRRKLVVSPLWCSLGRAIFAVRKHDSPDFSISCYFTDLDILMLTEEGVAAATV